jgi:hypothetical protein
LFRDWQRTQTQSSVTALRARDSKWMSGPAGMQGPPAERHLCAVKDPDPRNARALRSAPGASCFSLDFDLHGSRLSGQMTGNFGSELSQILDQASGGRWRGIASFARRTETSSEPGSHRSMRSWVRMIPPTTILQLSPGRFSSALNTFFATRF